MTTAVQEGTNRTLTVLHGMQVLAPVGAALTEPDASEYQLRDVLSRTLDIELLMELFCARLEVAHDGYAYRNDQLHIDCRHGAQGGNHLEYRLVLGDEDLGVLAIHRHRRATFEQPELELMERRLCSLVYPLRNAVMYRSALISAFSDPLTGVDNRAALENRLPREIQLAQRHATPISLLVMDVDHFKGVNDAHGHHVGDQVLCRVVEVFQTLLRTTDLIYRYGGDEFVVVLSNTAADGAMHVAERIRERVERCRFEVGNVRLVLGTSIGVTQLTPRDDRASVFQRADDALLEAKRRGRNRVVYR